MRPCAWMTSGSCRWATASLRDLLRGTSTKRRRRGRRGDGGGRDEAEEETIKEDEAGREKVADEACDVMEIELGDDHMEDEEMETAATEEKEEEAGADTEEEVADCEANTDKSIREGSDITEPTEEVVTNAK
ncbi:hypothetical protein L3Q82_006085 [Scortum barcoo]|uniref:Uncharacterized protein n=1 Tax=Scortum barcoo TaxID=214431 RepID=A0ACB8X2D5_9TELE|nr:hypothetical protein L3Q82_006085 [Scortum barcoo]